MDVLRSKVAPKGGTNYLPAWEKVQQCANHGRPNARLLVVMVTDGAAPDINAAASCAKKLYDHQASSKNSMVTLVVNIDNEVPEKVLDPLVKAGNGGKVALDVRGSPAALYYGIQTVDMVAQFKLLATMPLSEADEIKSRVAHFKQVEFDDRERLRQSMEQDDLKFEKQLKSIDALSRALAKSSEEDAVDEAQDTILQLERQRIQDEIKETKKCNDDAKARLRQFQEDKSREEEKLKALHRVMEAGEENFEILQQSLTDLQKTSVDELKAVAEDARAQLQHMGTVDAKYIIERVLMLNDLHTKHDQYRLLLQHTYGTVSSLQRFTKRLTAAVREPLKDVEGSVVSKANFVFKLILEDRGIVGDVSQPSASSNLKLYLTHEAKAMCMQENRIDEVVETVLSSNIEAEEICSICGASTEDVDDLKQQVLAKLKQHVLDAAGISGKSTSSRKMKEMREELKSKKKELAIMKARMTKALHEDVVESEDKIEEMEKTCEDLEEKIDEAKKVDEEMAEALAEARGAQKLVERAFLQCSLTYSRQCEAEKIRELKFIFRDLYKSVVMTINDFCVFVEKQEKGLKAVENAPRVQRP